MTGAASRRRGADAERAVVAWLRSNGWPDARRYLAGDGRQPGDIDCWPGVAIEVKDRKASSWPAWRAQALIEASGRIPVVVRRTRGEPNVGRWTTEVRATGWDQLGGRVLPCEWCPRTGRTWVRTEFAALAALMRDEVESDLTDNQLTTTQENTP